MSKKQGKRLTLRMIEGMIAALGAATAGDEAELFGASTPETDRDFDGACAGLNWLMRERDRRLASRDSVKLPLNAGLNG